MNKLTISKKGYWDDYEEIARTAKICSAIGSPPFAPESIVEQFQYVRELLGEPTRIFYYLKYPERFYPRNASQHFWEKIGKYIEKGIMFEVETSDVIAAGWVRRTRTYEGETQLGWDEVYLERYYKEEGDFVKEDFSNVKSYGSDIHSLNNKFRF